MEDVPAAPVVWDDDRYAAAARALGRLGGRTHREGLPADAPPFDAGLRMLWSMRISPQLVSTFRDDAIWQHPLMATAAEADPPLRADLLSLAAEAPAILDQLDRLPQGLSHDDACPQNLLPDPDRDGAFVAIDWGFTAIAPLGTDLVQLLAGRADNGELDAADMPHTEEVILASYVAGLADEDVAVDPTAVRAAFTGGLLVGKAFSALPVERLGGHFGEATSEFFLQAPAMPASSWATTGRRPRLAEPPQVIGHKGAARTREPALAFVFVAGSARTAAHRLGLSHSTVKHHLANARSRVGAATTAQLVGTLAPRLPAADAEAHTGE